MQTIHSITQSHDIDHTCSEKEPNTTDTLNQIRSHLLLTLNQHKKQDTEMFKQYSVMSHWLMKSGFHKHPAIKTNNIERYILKLGEWESSYKSGMICLEELIEVHIREFDRTLHPILKLMDYVYLGLISSDNIVELFYYFILFENLLIYLMRIKKSRLRRLKVPYQRIRHVFDFTTIHYESYRKSIDYSIIRLIG
jgi:hypothetical protein